MVIMEMFYVSFVENEWKGETICYFIVAVAVAIAYGKL
jgi:hypothetical protein